MPTPARAGLGRLRIYGKCLVPSGQWVSVSGLPRGTWKTGKHTSAPARLRLLSSLFPGGLVQAGLRGCFRGPALALSFPGSYNASCATRGQLSPRKEVRAGSRAVLTGACLQTGALSSSVPGKSPAGLVSYRPGDFRTWMDRRYREQPPLRGPPGCHGNAGS